MRSRLNEHVMRALLADIVGGVFDAGDRVPTETDLVERFSTSRGVIREAMRGIEERGVVNVRQGHGAVVTPARNWNLLDREVLTAVLETTASVQVLTELLECRRILEVEASALAAVRATGDDLALMADAVVQMTAAANQPERTQSVDDLFHEADISFHDAIYSATRNRILPRVVEPIQRALHSMQRRLAHPEARLQTAIPEHKAILSAIASGNADQARESMMKHLDTVEHYLEKFKESIPHEHSF